MIDSVAKYLHNQHMVNLNELRTCNKCGISKNVSEFRGSRKTCKKCTYDARDRAKEEKVRKERYRNDPEFRQKTKDDDQRHRKGNPNYLKKKYAARNLLKYGLTPEMEAELLEKQKHRCPCCNRKFSDEVKMHRDHDHNLNHFRGFLCNNCNVALGMVEGTGNPERALLKLLEIVRDNALFYAAHPEHQSSIL